jgi:hypothetical protein
MSRVFPSSYDLEETGPHDRKKLDAVNQHIAELQLSEYAWILEAFGHGQESASEPSEAMIFDASPSDRQMGGFNLPGHFWMADDTHRLRCCCDLVQTRDRLGTVEWD